MELTPEERIHDLSRVTLKAGVPPGVRFRRQDLLLALEKLRSEASPELKPLLDQALRATLSDEQRRLLILQAVYDQDIQELRFLGATGVASDVLNEMPDLVNFLTKAFPPDSPSVDVNADDDLRQFKSRTLIITLANHGLATLEPGPGIFVQFPLAADFQKFS
jgi:hypothetical protein